ncbi:brachyurin-like isoform X2 [Thrips palmi]|uniref:Brachyurin-like isoform X2 n=1 Tax=Thrips palmi TaxID=161013 RepID=A0A6P8XY56_THRPL|nr:brachyurin-like isoform X2 [Thrips palmi]
MKLFQVCLASPAPPRVARALLQPRSNVRIIDGGDAAPFQFPWQAALLAEHRFFCGGSIIAPTWILTAGHCVDPLTEFHVVVGALTMPKGHEASRQRFKTNRRFLHPRYDVKFLDNDIGMLQLPTSIEFNIFVQAVALPSYSAATVDWTGVEARVSGWGKTTDLADHNSPMLKFTTLKVVANAVCEHVYGNTMIANKLCLSSDDGGHGVCQGDSGGALVVRQGKTMVQIGITSFVSLEGCTVGMPQGFTRVTAFLDFIEETTGIHIED